MRKIELVNAYGSTTPFFLLWAPRPNQIDYLDPVTHASEPDFDAFVDDFYIEVAAVPDCDSR